MVEENIVELRRTNIGPISTIIILLIFIPVCIFLTLHITGSMTTISRLYDTNCDTYRTEKRKTEKLLESLLPLAIIRRMKKGRTPKHFWQTISYY